jgi:hypothetical protein
MITGVELCQEGQRAILAVLHLGGRRDERAGCPAGPLALFLPRGCGDLANWPLDRLRRLPPMRFEYPNGPGSGMRK